jgi:hypothetical protein
MDHGLQFGVEDLPLRHENSVHSYAVGRVHLLQNPDQYEHSSVHSALSCTMSLCGDSFL